MNFIFKYFMITVLFISSVYAKDGEVKKLKSIFKPENGKNGYIGEVITNYKMIKCAKLFHIVVRADYKVNLNEYIYEGKSYTASDLGIDSFPNKKILNLTELGASLYNGSVKVGELKLRNVPDYGAMGCLGESYEVKKQITSIDEESALKQLEAFSLKPSYAYSTLSDFDIEKMIKDKNTKAAVTSVENEKKEESKQSTGAKTPKSKKLTQSSTGKMSERTTTENSKVVNKKTKPKLSAHQELKKINQKNQKISNQTKKQSQNIAKAAGQVGNIAAGLLDSGIALGVGGSSNDEDNTLLLSIAFGSWTFPRTSAESGKFWSGTYTYFAFATDDYIQPTEGKAIDKGEDKFTENMLGVNFLNNSLGMDFIQPVWGISLNFIDEYDENGYAKDELGTEIGFDYGVALVLVDSLLVTWTHNTAAEADAIHFIFSM